MFLDLTLDYMLSFDGTDVSSFITPSSTSYTTDASATEGGALVTDIQGKVEFSFRIPEYRFAGQSNIPNLNRRCRL